MPFETQLSLWESFVGVIGEDEQSIPKDGSKIRVAAGGVRRYLNVMTRRPGLQGHGTRAEMMGYRPGTRL